MDESPCVRRLVVGGVVRMTGRVSFDAGCAAVDGHARERQGHRPLKWASFAAAWRQREGERACTWWPHLVT
eukprot:4504235-Pleurochrysis_carterae.AAC.1